MRFSFDPELQTLLAWRENQNIVLTLLLNEISHTPESERKNLPFRWTITDTQRAITDQTGTTICEFSFLSGGVILVNWIRSWQDYVQMDHVGQKLRKERMDGKAIFTI